MSCPFFVRGCCWPCYFSRCYRGSSLNGLFVPALQLLHLQVVRREPPPRIAESGPQLVLSA
eukprot:1583965-Pyramimonas_sp.AAC.1